MNLTKDNLRAFAEGSEQNRVAALKELLGYPVAQLDPQSGNFWYLRPGVSEDEALETCPIAVGFIHELNDATDAQIKQLLTREKKQEIYGHYSSREDIVNQPVMYLLLPTEASTGRIPLVLPAEGGLRQRQIQTFEWNDSQLIGRLEKLRQGKLPIAERAVCLVPQVDWVFYEPVKTAGELARALAEAARRIEQAIPKVYRAEGKDGYLHSLLKSFQKELLPTLQLTSDNEKDYSFADIYAQTIAYGLFTARVFSYIKDKKAGKTKETDFNRQDAWKLLPETNPFLRKLFEDVSKQNAEELGEGLVGAVADIFSILRAAKMDAILSDFEMKMNREDIVIRFYEDFLAAYKPQMRERRGVYYTPEPVVSYMVRSVDMLLKEKFNKPLGLADPEVMILDPACGTGTFLLYICQLIYQRFQSCPEDLTEGLEDKSWSGYVKERLLPRIFGFELLMAPYAIAHLKLGLFLQETGYQFSPNKRIGIYLSNTLDDAAYKDVEQLSLPGLGEIIAKEASEGAKLKKQEPIMIVIGNPPYSGHSANINEWIKSLINNYKENCPELSKPGQGKWLNDDYVKFLRFAQWRIDKTSSGILAMITNHSYLDNPTFRGMRCSLQKSFDEIFVINLHGSLKKKAFGNYFKDENIFDIQQGVAINIAIKNKNKKIETNNTYYKEIFGLREYKDTILNNHENHVNSKYDWLRGNDIKSTEWAKINPESPSYLFTPFNNDLQSEYNQGCKISDIFNKNGDPAPGVITTHDSFAISWNSKESIAKVNTLLATSTESEARNAFKLCSQNQWQYQRAKSELKDNNWHQELIEIIYRPFDTRWTVWNRNVAVHRRERVMRHLQFKNNLAITTCRQVVGNKWCNVFVTNWITDDCYVSNKTKERGYIFPLYLYPQTQGEKDMGVVCYPNLSLDFLKDITLKLGYTHTPEAIFYYIYAIFHSPTYRARYAEFLKIDFPRVPLTSNNELFCQLAEYGEQLVALHLMKSPKLDKPITKFVESKGNCTVDPGHPKYSNGAVTINKLEDKFTGVPEEVWNFHVGGYQVCQKWLKDRKGRRLTDEDIQHYQRVVVALKETIALMKKIDDAIPGFPIQ